MNTRIYKAFKGPVNQWLRTRQFTVKLTGSRMFPKRGIFGRVAELKVVIRDKERHKVAQFKLAALPSCYAVLVSGNSWVSPTYRRQGVAVWLQRMKKAIAVHAKADLLLCTVCADNKGQLALLEKSGWFEATEFSNKRTGNDLMLMLKHVYGGKVRRKPVQKCDYPGCDNEGVELLVNLHYCSHHIDGDKS